MSAVTHELRTPLTTLADVHGDVAEGMVRDEEKRQSYLQTMRAEADRLGIWWRTCWRIRALSAGGRAGRWRRCRWES